MFYPTRTTPLNFLSRTYIVPALLLNPILFLHSLNTILSRILSPIIVPNTTVQPIPYSTKGPSAEHPHVDIRASDTLCWSYTIVMVGMQLVAFRKVQTRRAEVKATLRSKTEETTTQEPQKVESVLNGANENKYDHAKRGTAECQRLDVPLEHVDRTPREVTRVFDDPLTDEKGSDNLEESEIIP